VLRTTLAEEIGQQLGEAEGVIVFDPSAFPKKGSQSVGVARQWCGRLGKIDNCQVGVYMAYVTSKGHALVDGELFLPKEWTKDRWRLKAARVPKARWHHKTRHELCLEMLDRHQVRLPHQWVTGDNEMGRATDFRRALRERREQYLLAVPSNTLIRDLQASDPAYRGNGRPPKRPHSRVDRWQQEQPKEKWVRIDVSEGEKGPILVEAFAHPVASSKRGRENEAAETLVVIRFEDRDSNVTKTDYYLSNASHETSLQEFCRVARAEHRIEECFERAKGQAGLADYEVRNWIGWQHHQTLSLMACWFLTLESQRAEKKDTCDDGEPSSTSDRFGPEAGIELRFDQGHDSTHRTEAQAKSTRQALPLETT
jgi:SRSO17 transposase